MPPFTGMGLNGTRVKHRIVGQSQNARVAVAEHRKVVDLLACRVHQSVQLRENAGEVVGLSIVYQDERAINRGVGERLDMAQCVGDEDHLQILADRAHRHMVHHPVELLQGSGSEISGSDIHLAVGGKDDAVGLASSQFLSRSGTADSRVFDERRRIGLP